MKIVENVHLTGERAMFATRDTEIRSCLFDDGESPLKESSSLRIFDCEFGWKYPLWYCRGVECERTYFSVYARSGIWYTHGISLTDCTVDAPKTFRRCSCITLSRVDMMRAEESMWSCSDITLSDVSVRGDYFCMNSEKITAYRLRISGNYAFDGCRDVVIRDSVIMSKDAFWNCENVTVYDSVIVGEYLGWNSKNVRLVNCKLESNQGMCYMDGLLLEGCVTERTDLAFEYSTVDADIRSGVVSVKNPSSGRIVADSIGEIIHDPECVDTSKTEISVREKNV